MDLTHKLWIRRKRILAGSITSLIYLSSIKWAEIHGNWRIFLVSIITTSVIQTNAFGSTRMITTVNRYAIHNMKLPVGKLLKICIDRHVGINFCITSATLHVIFCQLSHPSTSSSSSSATSFSDKSFATRSSDEFSGDASNIGFWRLNLAPQYSWAVTGRKMTMVAMFEVSDRHNAKWPSLNLNDDDTTPV